MQPNGESAVKPISACNYICKWLLKKSEFTKIKKPADKSTGLKKELWEAIYIPKNKGGPLISLSYSWDYKSSFFKDK